MMMKPEEVAAVVFIIHDVLCSDCPFCRSCLRLIEHKRGYPTGILAELYLEMLELEKSREEKDKDKNQDIRSEIS